MSHWEIAFLNLDPSRCFGLQLPLHQSAVMLPKANKYWRQKRLGTSYVEKSGEVLFLLQGTLVFQGLVYLGQNIKLPAAVTLIATWLAD